MPGRLKEWFESEGYPLEFKVAQVFEEGWFVCHQGHYVTDEKERQPREVDVIADVTIRLDDDSFLRVSHVIESKWSRDKPWVVFTSKRSRMAESACIAQTLGSLLGHSVLFCLAGETSLYTLEMFKSPQRGGFSGRRAFEKQDKENYDQFYRTMQSVVSAAHAETQAHDQHNTNFDQALRCGVFAFPIVAVDAQLFEAFYDTEANEIRISEVDQIRVFWRGSRLPGSFVSPVDIVTESRISSFARARKAEVSTLLLEAKQAVGRIRSAYVKHNFDELELKAAPRGYVGFPRLLRDLYALTTTGEDIKNAVPE